MFLCGEIVFLQIFALCAKMEMTILLYIRRVPLVGAKHALCCTETRNDKTAATLSPIKRRLCSPASPRRETPDTFWEPREREQIWILIATVCIDTPYLYTCVDTTLYKHMLHRTDVNNVTPASSSLSNTHTNSNNN